MLSDIWNGNGFSTENNKNCNKFMQLLIHTVNKQLTHSYKLLGLQLQKMENDVKLKEILTSRNIPNLLLPSWNVEMTK